MNAEHIAGALGGHRQGQGWAAHCPAHDDGRASLSISERDGKALFHCHAGCSQERVLEALRARGLWPKAAEASKHNARPAGADTEEGGEIITPIPPSLLKPGGTPLNPPPLPGLQGEVKLDRIAAYIYRDAGGGVLGYIIRFERLDGAGKEPRPLTYWRDSKGRARWLWKGWPEPRPLYGLDRLAAKPDSPILILEGEKCADAANDALPAYVVLSWPFGANSTSIAKVDWNPLKRAAEAGRAIFLWPDNDSPGIRAMLEIAKRIAP